jgi:thiamine kinase-like enzyme
LYIKNKTENNMMRMANSLNLYEREYYFYESISNFLNINTPKFYGIIRDNNFEKIGILLENINNENYKLNLNLNEESLDVSLILIDNLAKMHSYFSNKELINKFDKLTKNNYITYNPYWNNFVNEKIDNFLVKWSYLIDDKTNHIFRTIAKNYQEIQNKLSSGNLTLCHGDFKSPNIFYRRSDYMPFLIDWQYIVEGKGVQDLIFLIIESFNDFKYFNIFIEYYYYKLLEYGITSYSREEYNKDIHYAMCYFPMLVAIWFGTINQEELIDKNFPYYFIKKYITFLNNFLKIEVIEKIN